MLEILNVVNKIKKDSLMNKEEMRKLADLFYNDMTEKKALKMLPAHIFMNDSINPGHYVAIDFGGTNVRIMLYEINSNVELILSNSRALRLKGITYDFTSEEYELGDIFGVIADKIMEIIEPDKSYLLGHTFSFPVAITGKNESKVVAMTKGFKNRNAIGQDVNKILKEKLDFIGLDVTPNAILNDTTATLLAGKNCNPKTDIACIVGTGHNICFVDNDNQIVNTECGSFNIGIPVTSYDQKFLEMISDESKDLMEAFVGGKNSGKMASNYMEIVEKSCGKFFLIEKVTPQLLSKALEDDFDSDFEGGIEEKSFLYAIAKVIYDRAAQLVVSELVGILKRIDPSLEREHHIVFDGSVYEKTPYFRKCITKYIRMMYPEKYRNITHSLVKDGSSLGAVIASAM